MEAPPGAPARFVGPFSFSQPFIARQMGLFDVTESATSRLNAFPPITALIAPSGVRKWEWATVNERIERALDLYENYCSHTDEETRTMIDAKDGPAMANPAELDGLRRAGYAEIMTPHSD